MSGRDAAGGWRRIVAGARRAAFVAGCAMGVFAALAEETPTEVVFDLDGVTGFELYRKGLYWWKGPGNCSSVPNTYGSIRMKGTVAWSGNLAKLFSCEIHQGTAFSVVRDKDFFYFFSTNQLQRKGAATSVPDLYPVEEMPTDTTPTLLSEKSSPLDLADGWLYWANYAAGPSGSLLLPVRMRADGGPATQTFAAIVDGGAPAAKLKAYAYIHPSTGFFSNAVALLQTDGKLYRCREGEVGELLAESVTDFAIHHRSFLGTTFTYIYATLGTLTPDASSGPGELLEIRGDAIPPATPNLLYIASRSNQLISVTTDSDVVYSPLYTPLRNIYIAEAAFSCAPCAITNVMIVRKNIFDLAGSFLPILTSGGGINLRSDDVYLYFRDSAAVAAYSIKRIRTDAPVSELDFEADSLEVVQVIQNMANEIPLVAYKDNNYARGYAHVRVNSTPATAFFPSARLEIFVSGLPFGTVDSINNPPIDTTTDLGVLRPNRDRAYLFKLPALPPCNLTLRMTVNGDHAYQEVLASPGVAPYGNNYVTLGHSVPVTRQDSPCVTLVPMNTPAGIYRPGIKGGNFFGIIDRATSLLPARALTLLYLENEAFLEDNDFFNDPEDDGKADLAIERLTELRKKTKSYPGCEEHWAGMVHWNIPGKKSDGSKFAGIGNNPGLNLVVNMNPGGSLAWNAPLGGRIMAHELAHNFGKSHVNQTLSGLGCGLTPPKDPYGPGVYPFDTCCFGFNSPERWYGFDPISQLVVTPCAAGDLMSYANNRWPSIYHYGDLAGGLFRQLYVSASLAGAKDTSLQSLNLQPALLVVGIIDPVRHTATFENFDQFPPGAADSGRLAESVAASGRAANALNPYRFRLLDDAGMILADVPVEASDPSEGPHRLIFADFIPFHPATRWIQLVQGEFVLAERVVSWHAPVLHLAPVSVDDAAQTMSLAWNASDEDGDALLFTIQYSADNGATWTALRMGYPLLSATFSTRRLPGSAQARLRVIASDGANSTLADTPPFAVARHHPEAILGGVEEGQRLGFQSRADLNGVVFDAEDNFLSEDHLTWSLSGPTPFGAGGHKVPLDDLAPGAYNAVFSAIDSDGNPAMETRSFEILPMAIPDRPAPVLDGLCADAGYADARMVSIPLGQGAVARARLLHAGQTLFVSFTGLSLPAGQFGTSRVGLRIDANNSRDPFAGPGDAGFFVDTEGLLYQETGTANGMTLTPHPSPGFDAFIDREDGSWSAEFQIPDDLLGGWNHPISVMLELDSATWPPQANRNAPVTWSPAFAGAVLPPPGPMENRPPVAEVGEDRVINFAATRTIVLDGIGSFDPDAEPLTYQWAQIAGPAVVLDGATNPAASFSIPMVAATTRLRFQLQVSDGSHLSSPAETTITLLPTAAPPPSAPVRARIINGRFDGRFTLAPGVPYAIQATSNFVQWVNVRTNTADASGFLDFLLTDAATYPWRFYRAASLLPPNDDFAGAAPVMSTPAQLSASNFYATREDGEPAHIGDAGGRSLWWRWTAPQDGPVTISTEGSDFDTTLAVYIGDVLTQLMLVAADDDSGGNRTSRVQFAATAGRTYRIAVDGSNGASGNIRLTITASQLP